MKFIRAFLLTLVIGLGLLMFARSCYGAGLSLTWDPSPDTNVAGYAVYYGPLGQAVTNRIDVGPVLTCIVSNLARGTTYWFYVTAYDQACNESDPSNVINYTVPSADTVVVTVSVSTEVEGPWTDVFSITNQTTNSVFYRTRIKRTP